LPKYRILIHPGMIEKVFEDTHDVRGPKEVAIRHLGWQPGCEVSIFEERQPSEQSPLLPFSPWKRIDTCFRAPNGDVLWESELTEEQDSIIAAMEEQKKAAEIGTEKALRALWRADKGN